MGQTERLVSISVSNQVGSGTRSKILIHEKYPKNTSSWS